MALHKAVLMNMKDGSVQGHAAGCADLKRGKNFSEPFQADEVWEVKDREAAREEYNSDFDEETDGWYDIKWMPCAKSIPEREEAVLICRQCYDEFSRIEDAVGHAGTCGSDQGFDVERGVPDGV